MLRSRGLVLVLVVSSLAPPVTAASRSTAPFRILPGPYERKGRALGPPVGRLTLQGLTLQVEYLDREARAAFIRALDPRAEDPFESSAGRPEFYNAFRVEFDNRSTVDVTFQPGNVVLITDHEDQLSPIDLTDLYRTASLHEVSDPQQVIDHVGPLIFDLSTTIRRGERLARLLVFGPLPEKWKELRLHFSFLQIGADTHSLSFPFHKQVLTG
jgi:hypothetical protein